MPKNINFEVHIKKIFLFFAVKKLNKFNNVLISVLGLLIICKLNG